MSNIPLHNIDALITSRRPPGFRWHDAAAEGDVVGLQGLIEKGEDADKGVIEGLRGAIEHNQPAAVQILWSQYAPRFMRSRLVRDAAKLARPDCLAHMTLDQIDMAGLEEAYMISATIEESADQRRSHAMLLASGVSPLAVLNRLVSEDCDWGSRHEKIWPNLSRINALEDIPDALLELLVARHMAAVAEFVKEYAEINEPPSPPEASKLYAEQLRRAVAESRSGVEASPARPTRRL